MAREVITTLGHASACHRRRPRLRARKCNRSSKMSSTVCSMFPIPGPKYVSKTSRAVTCGRFQSKGNKEKLFHIVLENIHTITEGLPV